MARSDTVLRSWSGRGNLVAIGAGAVPFILGAGLSHLFDGSDFELRARATEALVVYGVALLTVVVFWPRRFGAHPAAPWVVAGIPTLLGLGLFLLHQVGGAEYTQHIFTTLMITPADPYFHDTWVIQSFVDCARNGSDVYDFGGPCGFLTYGSGVLWLQYLPGMVFTASNTALLGLVTIALLGVALFVLARKSSTPGQVVLLLIGCGGAIQLGLERGNLDILVVSIFTLLSVWVLSTQSARKWAVAFGAVWLMGTWKYYPFALAAGYFQILRTRLGWIIAVVFGAATAAFIALNVDQIRSAQDYNASIDPRCVVHCFGAIQAESWVANGPLWLKGLLGASLILAATSWFVMGLVMPRSSRIGDVHVSLALGGVATFLLVVFVSGSGFSYKIAFLLLAVPLLSHYAVGRGPNLLPRFGLVLLTLAGMLADRPVGAMVTFVCVGSLVLGLSARFITRSMRSGSECVTSSDHHENRLGLQS